MRQVVLISGRLCSGKSGLARRLEREFGYHKVLSRDLLKEISKKIRRGGPRVSLQKLAQSLEKKTRGRWLFEEIEALAKKVPPDTPIVIDYIFTAKQLECFRKSRKWQVIHAHLYASLDTLKKRFKKKIRQRNNNKSGKLNYSHCDFLKNSDVDEFKKDADVRIYTERTDGRDTFIRVAARLGLYSDPGIRCVDVLVGGQFGSEGKGHVAAYLARNYDVLIRVGGPNAGHTVSSESGIYTYHQLPSGCRDTKAKILLGPGMTINVKRLVEEIKECRVTSDRLFIDPQAMIISPRDKKEEKTIVGRIGSTGQGSGAAAARRIRDRKPGAVRLARNVPELRKYVGDKSPYRGSTVKQLELAYNERQSILLEGTQGSGLSLYHGQYPYVTSRDTNVAGCLAEAGISPSRVRRILMVIRTTPIRVGNPAGKKRYTSGPLKHGTTFEVIAEEAGLDPNEVPQNERTSTTKRPRRVGWFDWEQFRNACALNAPTDIVLTFADYISVANQKARRFEQLTEDTIKFIEEIERIAQAPVSLINTRFPRKPEEKFDLRTIIDRRNWTSQR